MTGLDDDLIAKTEAALCWWDSLAQGPTSTITGGGAISYVEGQFSQLMGGRPCLAVSSGTEALAAALIGVGVHRGDEIICSAYDWPAATDAINRIGARPVYADPDPATLTIDPARVAERLTPNSTAVIATHLYGIPADIPALKELTKNTSRVIPVIEDASQALGARLDGRPTGTLGDAAAFSLGPGKPIDAGEGGVVVFETQEAWRRAVAATQHPVRQLLSGLEPNGPFHSARISPLSAILAAHQLINFEPAAARHEWREVQDQLQAAGLETLPNDDRREPIGRSVVIRTASVHGGTAESRHRPLGGHWLGHQPAPAWLETLGLMHK